MNRLIIGLAVVGLLFLYACANDKELGKVDDLSADHVLPQGKSSADDRIVKLFNDYGGYFLYDFTRRDFDWMFINTDLNPNAEGGLPEYSYTPADPEYAGEMLDLLDRIWLQFYPKSFLKKTIPYRVLLVDSLLQINRSWDETDTLTVRLQPNQLVLTCCSGRLKDMSAENKREYKNRLQKALLHHWWDLKIVAIPEEFYEVSDYSRNAEEDPDSDDYARKRGFLASYDDEEEEYIEWSTDMYGVDELNYRSLDQNTDVMTYLDRMIEQSETDWEEDLAYELVKRKYDILRNYFLEQYGFDLQAIGNETCE